MIYKRVTQCRFCGDALDDPVLDFGDTPIGDVLCDTPNQSVASAPLAICNCPSCQLLQLTVDVDPSAIYNQDYPYFSSAIQSLVSRMATWANQAIQQHALGKDSKVLEIASNDGYLLQHFSRISAYCLGVEPCEKQAQRANELGIQTINAFFNREFAQDLLDAHGRFDLVIANNVVAHVSNINDFLQGIKLLLNEQGTAVFEFHDADALIANTQFDAVYHQHIFYFSLASFTTVLQSNQLYVQYYERIDAYGGALRVAVGHHPKDKFERESVSTLEGFAQRTSESIKTLQTLITEHAAQGKQIVAYGATAKGVTLLAACEVGSLIDFCVDKSAHKQGKYLPASHIKIVPPEYLRDSPPDCLLILAWNYADEIEQEWATLKQHGCEFIVPHINPSNKTDTL